RRAASPTIWQLFHLSPPKWTASAIPASRAAADEPHPLPMGNSFLIVSESAGTRFPCDCKISEYVFRIRWSSTRLQMAGSRPLATMENFLDFRDRTSSRRSKASAAASKAGPMFAEVAGRLIWNVRMFGLDFVYL